MSETTYKKIIDIHCPMCGGVSDFDIVKQRYHCAFCGGDLGISEALKEKQGFRMLQAEKLRESLKRYKLFHAVCEFPEGNGEIGDFHHHDHGKVLRQDALGDVDDIGSESGAFRADFCDNSDNIFSGYGNDCFHCSTPIWLMTL